MSGRLAFLSTTVGLVCALALVPLALVVPVYRGETASETGVTETTGTLVGVNGYWILVPVCVPPVLALAGWIGLHLRCARGSRAGTVLGRSSACVLGFFAVLASASIGLFVLPAALCLFLGAVLTPEGSV